MVPVKPHHSHLSFTVSPQFIHSPVIVFDFETTGQNPELGDRPIEVGAVCIEKSVITDRFQSLMNPGFPVTSFIESLTGIGNDVLEEAPPCGEVIAKFSDWMGQTPLVAHNIRFDSSFLSMELKQLGQELTNPMACTVRLSRRLYPRAPNHKLSTMVDYLHLDTTGTFHRALADAEMTGHLWMAMLHLLAERYQLNQIPFSLMQKVMRTEPSKQDALLRDFAEKNRQPTLFSFSG